MEHCILHNHAGVAELADALDSKSSAREGVPVRPRPPVSQKKGVLCYERLLFLLPGLSGFSKDKYFSVDNNEKRIIIN